jgi:hypothetical protein
MLPLQKIRTMDTLIIKSKSKSNARLLSTLARKLGEQIETIPQKKETCLAIESAWAKDWLTPEEDEAWKDL